jgi:hypothetical protein
MPAREQDEHAPDFRALAELADMFMVLVAALREGRTEDLTPEGVVALAGRCMPRAQHVAILAHVDGRPRDVAASSGLPGRIDRIRAQTREGPSLDVLETNDVVISGDLAGDPRWPSFGHRVVYETNIRSVASYRLFFSSRHHAALTFYSDWPHAFDDVAIATGAIFASYASLVTAARVLFGQTVGRSRAVSVQQEIGVAVGILMADPQVSTEAAYHRLHDAAHRLGDSLPETARHVIEHRRLP